MQVTHPAASAECPGAQYTSHMRIVLLGHEDIASLYALNRVVALAPGHEYQVFWSGDLAPSGVACPELGELAALDRSMFTDFLAAPSTASAFGVATPLPKPNSTEGLTVLRAAAPELVVSIRYRRILREDSIRIPELGVLNLHSGILPDYRGVMATFWAMLNREASIGSTLHRIVDSGIDTGPVVAISRRPADYTQTYLWNVLSLYADGAAAVADSIEALARGDDVPGTIQPSGAGAYYSAPGPGDVRAFLAAGLRLADDADFALADTASSHVQPIDNT